LQGGEEVPQHALGIERAGQIGDGEGLEGVHAPAGAPARAAKEERAALEAALRAVR
jgi:hypothetical protein